MIQAPISDRERCGLHGPVKSIVEEWSTTIFDRDGKILEWTGNTSGGRSERKYVYDEGGRLLRISGSNRDHVDEFRYDDRGRKTRIRRVPARSDGNAHGFFGMAAWFECVSKGETLNGGGTVETTYNEDDQPVEARIRDEEGTVLFRIVYTYDAAGLLGQEKLTTENISLPKAFRDQIPVEHRAATLAQMKTQLEEISQRSGLFGHAERTYVYDDQGRIAERHMRMGPIREDLTLTYNERGDIGEATRTSSGLPNGGGGVHTEPTLKSTHVYDYDSLGNWTSRTESSRFGEAETTHTHPRQLTYYD